MHTASDVTQLIGNTPLLHLKQVSELTGCTILGKAEFLNPGGSVKDRTALGIIRAAEESGELQPGGRIVEGTAGNTGIGLTLLANALGYKSTVVMPITQSKEKIDSLELLGADLHLVGATSYKDPNHYIPPIEFLIKIFSHFFKIDIHHLLSSPCCFVRLFLMEVLLDFPPQ